MIKAGLLVAILRPINWPYFGHQWAIRCLVSPLRQAKGFCVSCVTNIGAYWVLYYTLRHPDAFNAIQAEFKSVLGDKVHNAIC